MLESGNTKALSDIRVGDRVLVASMDGRELSYSPIIAIPHGENSERSIMTKISIESGTELTLTPDHLVVAGSCDAGSVMSLRLAGDIKVGTCVQSIISSSGRPTRVKVIAVSSVNVNGIYTAVALASDKLLVVNGVVASPFAVNHLLVNAYYELHRVIYRFAPWILSLDAAPKVSTIFGNIMASYF